jgi:hypothetical protein
MSVLHAEALRVYSVTSNTVYASSQHFGQIPTLKQDKKFIRLVKKSRDSALGIATGYELEDRVVEVRILEELRNINYPYRPDRFRDPHSPYAMCAGDSFSGGKAARA